MGIGKWIGGILGWTLAGPFGALLGVGIASLFEKGSGSYFSQQTPQYNNFMVSLLILAPLRIGVCEEFHKGQFW